MKTYLKNIISSIIIFILLITLTGCDNKDKDESLLNEKVSEELKYLDLEVVSLINSLNNITIENYKISAKEITLRRLRFKW